MQILGFAAVLPNAPAFELWFFGEGINIVACVNRDIVKLLVYVFPVWSKTYDGLWQLLHHIHPLAKLYNLKRLFVGK